LYANENKGRCLKGVERKGKVIDDSLLEVVYVIAKRREE